MQGITPLLGQAVAVANAAYDIDIDLAASATTDGMDITFTMKDKDGNTLTGVTTFFWWISEDAQGEGLTADSYSGDVTTVTGTELAELTSKKLFIGQTTVAGVLTALAVASANPTDQYVCALNPVTGKVHVSAASGTNWEGA